ncbi:DUF3105 domain-containing protein [Streptomyces sp. NPDC002889]|uniref:DUF3105 domain-containing protein n=1 Tax=Streptomyces sp. NPDC002889 TaxID=3364669 RepID=UPI00369202C3
MASRNTENDRRARIEQMRRADQARERRGRIITISVSAVVVAALVGFGAFVLNKKSEEKEQAAADAKAPIQDEKSWDPKKLGNKHVTKTVVYPMKPPVGGDHNEVWMNCNGDVYDKQIPDMNAVHSLEHGAVWVTYTDKASDADVKKLGERVKGTPFSLMSPYKNQEGAIMLSAWGKQVSVDSADDPRVAKFFTKYVNGPQTPERGAPCTNGMGAQ